MDSRITIAGSTAVVSAAIMAVNRLLSFYWKINHAAAR